MSIWAGRRCSQDHLSATKCFSVSSQRLLDTRIMLSQLIAGLMGLAATLIQMRLSLEEVGKANRKALQHKFTEDELIEELPRSQRRRARKALVRDREPEVHQAIRKAHLHVLSWALLTGAATAVVVSAFIPGV